MKKIRTTILVLLITMLNGCAHYESSTVTTFQDWPEDNANKRFAFDPNQLSDLEKNTYECLIAKELSSFGFQLVPSSEADYLVTVSYGSKPVTLMSRQSIGPSYSRGGIFNKFPMSIVASSSQLINMPYAAVENFLEIRINNKFNGHEVYRVNARDISHEENLPHLVPYLVRSALKKFPFSNGSVHKIKIKQNEISKLPKIGSPGCPKVDRY